MFQDELYLQLVLERKCSILGMNDAIFGWEGRHGKEQEVSRSQVSFYSFITDAHAQSGCEQF